MIQIKLLKNWKNKKVGEIINISKNGAEQFVKEGAGEYLNLEKENIRGVHKFLAEKYFDNAKYNEQEDIIEIGKEKKENSIRKIFSIKGQVEQYVKINPFFYDKAKIFWRWNEEEKKYSICDETDLLNNIEKELGLETIDSKKRNELVESFKQVGRNNTPKKPNKSWVQFLDKVYNGISGEFLFYATSEYHFMNPICWKVGISKETPKIDELFNQWVGEEHKKELYEFLAYLITRDRFLQRIFAFCGGGSNGKGTFIKLCIKFIGKDNCVASELRQLAESQFEPAVLYGKLLCVMGEVSYSDLKNTNEIKKIAGEDLMSYQFKGKTPFTEENSSLAVCLTNSLPTTPDKSIGFYRKWHIIDFPNQFDGISINPIDLIPNEEFENLCYKCLEILKELYKTKKLSNEGNFEERIRRYEERSNPVMQFINEYCQEDSGSCVPLREFTNYCNEYLKSHHLRILTANQQGKILREEGFAVGPRKINDISQVVILNLLLKDIRTIKTILNSSQNLYKKTTEKLDSFSSLNSLFSEEEIKSAGYSKEELENLMKK